MNDTDCQVLVVGAGPTGLMLAAELLARGIRTRIIDKGDGVALQTRAVVALQKVYHDGKHASHVVLPIIPLR